MKNISFFIISIVIFLSCAEYENYRTYPSIDSKYIIDVVKEYQVGNSPDPFWEHISIRESEIESPILPGNVLSYSCFNPPDIIWVDNKKVEVILHGPFGDNFKYQNIPDKIVKGITFSFKIKNVSK